MARFTDLKLTDLLDDINIRYSGSGKNVSSDWLGVTCPFCNDRSNHCGIHRDSKNFSCWMCGEKGSLPKLIKRILNAEWKSVFDLIQKHSTGIVKRSYIESNGKTVTIPKHLSQQLSPNLNKYLEQRKFDPEYIKQQFYILDGGLTGFFKFRVVLPVYINNELISMIGRDYTGLMEERYKALPGSKSLLPLRDCLYNLDKIQDKGILVEGPLDTWHIPDYGIGLMGLKLSPIKIYHIYRKKLKKLFVCLDKDQGRRAEKCALLFSSFIPEVKILFLETGKDIPEINKQELIELKKLMI